jgi:hypothetical protein
MLSMIRFFSLILTICIIAGCTDPVHRATRGAGLPSGAKIVATKADPELAQDAHCYLIFDTDADGVEKFVLEYAGIPLSHFLKSRTELQGADEFGTWIDTLKGMPLWNLKTITNGRFFSPSGTNGFVSIDMDTYRVYVFD